MIDAVQDAALFCEKPGKEIAWDELADQIGDMQLIVMPVSARTLTEENRAVAQVLPLAKEKYIPVLPLMMEGGLDSAYADVFGDLEYLEPDSGDMTAIPFETKLAMYLKGVLGTDQERQKVRDAFAATIFLSYRKKDRASAQELMRLIHSHERFRDIAIWYDEYLVPGESFNDAIKAAMDRSRLFALTVTPSLLEYPGGNPNYVMQYEYPEAKKSGKPVLPLEMIKTNRLMLEKEYPQIPSCVNAHKQGQMERALTEKIKVMKVPKKKNTPAHEYLIGLAYLDGIDMEVNTVRAVRMITRAAQNGHEPAIRKLIAMYKDGKGVERSYSTSAEWRVRLIDRLSETGRDSTVITRELRRLADAYVEIGQPQKAKICMDRINRLMEEGTSAVPVLEQVLNCRSMGETETDLGHPEEALKWFVRADERADAYKAKEGYDEVRFQQSVLCIMAALLEKEMHHPSETDRWLDKAIRLSENLYEKAPGIRTEQGIAYAYSQAGYLFEDRQDYAKAEEYFRKALLHAERLAEQEKTSVSRMNVSVLYDRMGSLAGHRGQWDEAGEWYAASRKIKEAEAEESGTLTSFLNLMGGWQSCGTLEERKGNLEKAREWYDRARVLGERLAGETKSEKVRQKLAGVYMHLYDNAEKRRDEEEAAKWFEASDRLRTALYGENRSDKNRGYMYAVEVRKAKQAYKQIP